MEPFNSTSSTPKVPAGPVYASLNGCKGHGRRGYISSARSDNISNTDTAATGRSLFSRYELGSVGRFRPCASSPTAQGATRSGLGCSPFPFAAAAARRAGINSRRHAGRGPVAAAGMSRPTLSAPSTFGGAHPGGNRRRSSIDPQAGLGWTGLHPRVYLLSARLPHRLAAGMDARPGRGVGDHGYGKLARKH